MKINSSFLIYLSLIILNNVLCQNLPILDPSQEDHLEQVYETSFQLFQKLLLNSTESLRGNISEQCINNFNQAYNGSEWRLFIHKFITDSSKNKADLGSFRDCHYTVYEVGNQTTKSIQNNLSYIIFNIELKSNDSVTSLNYSEGEYFIGVCVASGCHEYEYKQIFIYINNLFEMFGNLTNSSSIRTLDMKKDGRKNISWFSFIPPSLIIIFASFSLFPLIPSIILNPFYKHRTFNSMNRIKACFKLFYNSKEILSTGYSKDKHLISNDIGINIFQGIRSITYLFFLLGVVFIQIFINPTRIFLKHNFSKQLTSFSFSFVIYGIRFAPKLLYAVSGLILVFKMLHYLDNQIDIYAEEYERENFFLNKDKDKDRVSSERLFKETNTSYGKDFTSLNSNQSDNIRSNQQIISDDPFVIRGEQPITTIEELIKEQEQQISKNFEVKKGFKSIAPQPKKDNQSLNPDNYMDNYKKLQVKFLFTFIFRTFYKYIMFIVALAFFKWSLISSYIKIFYPANAMWYYFREYYSSQFNITNHMLSHLFFYYGFKNQLYFQYDPFIIVGNEMLFFIITSVLIFYCYKSNKPLGGIIIIIIILLELLKIISYIALHYIEKDFHPVVSYHENEFSYIVNGALYNYPAFLIGVIFGLVNYCIQDSSKADKEKKFILISRKILKLLANKKPQRIITFVISLIILFICIFWQKMVLQIMGNQVETFNTNFWTNIVSLIDTEIGVFILLGLTVQLFLFGDNIFVRMLDNRLWQVFSRPYFTNILLTQCIAFSVFHNSENVVKIEFMNIFYFAFVILVLVLVIGLFIFVFVEIPLKRLNKLFFLKTDNLKLNIRDTTSLI